MSPESGESDEDVEDVSPAAEMTFDVGVSVRVSSHCRHGETVGVPAEAGIDEMLEEFGRMLQTILADDNGLRWNAGSDMRASPGTDLCATCGTDLDTMIREIDGVLEATLKEMGESSDINSDVFEGTLDRGDVNCGACVISHDDIRDHEAVAATLRKYRPDVEARGWEPLAVASRIHGLRLADIACPCVEVGEGPSVHRVLQDFKPTKMNGIILWLWDTGAGCFLSPHEEHILDPEAVNMSLSGVGSATSRSRSLLFLTTLDSDGEYNCLQYPKCYNVEPHVIDFAIASTGALERCGYTSHVAADGAYYITPKGRLVRLVTDQVTGFHFLVEHVNAKPSVMARNKLRADLAAKGKHALAARCLTSEPEIKPDACHTAASLDEFLRHHSQGRVSWNTTRPELRKDQVALEWIATEDVNAVSSKKDSGAGRRANDPDGCKDDDGAGRGEQPLRRAIRNYVRFEQIERDRVKKTSADVTNLPVTRAERATQERNKLQDGRKTDEGQVDNSKDVGSSTPTKVEPEDQEPKNIKDGVSDDEYFKKVKQEKERLGFKKPIRLRLPAIRLKDTGEEKDVQKLKRYVHDLFGHLELKKIYEAIDHIEGAEILRILKVVRGADGDAHCDSCMKGKANLPSMPRGRTQRPMSIREIEKIYVDLTGYIAEPSLYHNYHYAEAAVTDLGFAEIVGLAFRSQALLGMAKLISQFGSWPHEIQIDGESTLNTKKATAWMTGKGTGRSSKVTLTEAYNQFH